MKERPFENRVIIIGADHHNTLAAIRAFGQEGCEIAVIVHGHALERKKVQVFSSRYVDQNQAHIIQDNENELMKVLKQYGDEKQKDILFPASDFAEYVIDSNYDMLSPRFVCPGFVGKPGEVCRMMDKWNQYLFAKEHGISVAPTFLIDAESPAIPNELVFPCIVKPRTSAFGSKTDIAVCEDEKALLKTIEVYRRSGYQNCLAQQFILKKYEANALGYVLVTDRVQSQIGIVAVKEREQLESATSFAVIVYDIASSKKLDGFENKELLETNRKILCAMEEEGYSGHYDIDYLCIGDTVYLNEINFRHSGNGYAIVNEKMNAPVMWASGMLGLPFNQRFEQSMEPGSHFMAELYDMIYIKRRGMSIAQWIRDIRKTSSFAIYNSCDMRATKRYYKDRIGGIAKKAMCKVFGKL